jgi:hypothetical protein
MTVPVNRRLLCVPHDPLATRTTCPTDGLRHISKRLLAGTPSTSLRGTISSGTPRSRGKTVDVLDDVPIDADGIGDIRVHAHEP